MTGLPRAARLLALAGLALGCRSFIEEPPPRTSPRPAAGAVASEHPLATAAGIELLDAGGNAIDAAVATALALAVVYPQAGNLGGGGFALVVPHDGEPRALDFRETAPERLTSAAFVADGALVPRRSLDTHLAAGVPGSPFGLWQLHREGQGRLSFARVAAPALRLAREGFEVDAWLARDLASAATRARLERDADTRAIFYPAGEPLREGERLVQRDLAATLEQLVARGPRGFYEGEVAERIGAEMRAGGGVMTSADLAAYRPRWREPLRGWFRGHEIISMPPPSSGGVVLLQVLAVLDGLPLDAERRAALDAGGDAEDGVSERAVHWWIEALRRAFADRAVHLGDPDGQAIQVDLLLAPSWIAERRVSIGERATPGVAAYARAPSEAGGETTHLSVLDGDGCAVSLTTTLNASFGSGLVVGGAGFLLNNEIDDFSIVSGAPNAFGLVGEAANALAPGRRPLSSMTPTVIRDGRGAVVLVLGSPGGPRIISAVIQVVLRTLVYGQSLAAAVSAPRLHQQWKPAHTWFERGWEPALLDALATRGHALRRDAAPWSSVQALRVEPGGIPVGVSDPRRGGVAWTQGQPRAAPARPPVEADEGDER